jgi:hypothetical protein
LWAALALVAAAIASTVALLVRSRRRGGWNDDLAGSEREVEWFARELVPGMRQTGSVEQVAGAWAISEGRVAALEDRLTGLDATAYDEDGRARARSLRDAVRAARGQVAQVATSGTPETLHRDLDAAIATLEGALGQPPAAT